MHVIRLAPAALFGVGALVLGAPAALTDDQGDGSRDSGRRASFDVHVTPSTVSAGGRVSLRLNRGDGCRGAATVSSDVFDTVRIPEGRDSVAATVHRDARTQASYRVTFDCDGTRGSTELSIAGSRSEEHGDGGTDSLAAGQSEGRTDGRTDGQSDSHRDEHADDQSGSHTDGHADDQSDGSTDERTDGRTDGGVGGQTDSRTDGREDLNPQPLPLDRGVRAGAGGSVGGFDPKAIGLGAALVVASVGTAYHLARRRTGEDGEDGA
ncbi:hypothetical protein ABT075_25470 [Streptomyces sp. NPDC002677]|uniref:hypothetical protein n=1 Tax=Streptomyces sp. NPDC002677 TaxID=3154774 RepID=UPI00332CFE67